jgi:hypothetical protein
MKKGVIIVMALLLVGAISVSCKKMNSTEPEDLLPPGGFASVTPTATPAQTQTQTLTTSITISPSLTQTYTLPAP